MEQEKNISNNGGYSIDDIIWHQHSNHLLKKIIELWQDKETAIFDIGCGHNFYMSAMKKLGYITDGFDSMEWPGVHVADVTKPLPDLPMHPPINILSLEVGEHIPPELSNGYLDNLCKYRGDVILSWAILGQAGIGHINCQPNAWVIEQMEARGYIIDHEKTKELRVAVTECHCNWFRNTLMYFTRQEI